MINPWYNLLHHLSCLFQYSVTEACLLALAGLIHYLGWVYLDLRSPGAELAI